MHWLHPSCVLDTVSRTADRQRLATAKKCMRPELRERRNDLRVGGAQILLRMRVSPARNDHGRLIKIGAHTIPITVPYSDTSSALTCWTKPRENRRAKNPMKLRPRAQLRDRLSMSKALWWKIKRETLFAPARRRWKGAEETKPTARALLEPIRPGRCSKRKREGIQDSSVAE